MATKMTLKNNFQDLQEKIAKANGNLERAVERSMEAAANFLNPDFKAGIARHRRTGRTEAALIEHPNVEWEGNKAMLKTGFSVRAGGLAAIFINFGTKRGVKKDPFLDRAISHNRKKITEAQQEILMDELKGLGEK